MLNNSGESGHPCLVPDLRGNAFNFSPLRVMFAVGLSYMAFPPGSTILGILQARTLEWVAISFSNAWKWKVKVKSLSSVRLLVTPWTAVYQAPLSMGFPGKSTGVGCHCLLHIICDLYYVEVDSFYAHFLRSFNQKWVLNFVKGFFCIYWDDHIVFIFQFVIMVSHWLICIYWRILAFLE